MGETVEGRGKDCRCVKAPVAASRAWVWRKREGEAAVVLLCGVGGGVVLVMMGKEAVAYTHARPFHTPLLPPNPSCVIYTRPLHYSCYINNLPRAADGSDPLPVGAHRHAQPFCAGQGGGGLLPAYSV